MEISEFTCVRYNTELPAQEIYVFFDNIENTWMYEFVDNLSLNLCELDSPPPLHSINAQNSDQAIDLLKVTYPLAEILLYESMNDWLEDRVYNCKF